MPLVSVVIPAHNRADLLGQTLDSVRAQTLRDWECVVADDGSADDTPRVIADYAARDERFRAVAGRFGSASAARNRGAAAATGTYLSFLDSDDLMEPDKLAWQTAALEADAAATIVYGDTLLFHPGEPAKTSLYTPGAPRPRSFEGLLSFSAIYAPTVRAAAFRDAGGFDESLASAEDWDMWLSLARRGKLLFEPRVALRYRVHAGNKSGHTLRNFRCAVKVARKHLAHVPAARRPMAAARVYRYFARVYPLPLLAQARATGRRDALAAAALLRPRWFARYPSSLPGLLPLLLAKEMNPA